jgi:hypothetical protein
MVRGTKASGDLPSGTRKADTERRGRPRPGPRALPRVEWSGSGGTQLGGVAQRGDRMAESPTQPRNAAAEVKEDSVSAIYCRLPRSIPLVGLHLLTRRRCWCSEG